MKNVYIYVNNGADTHTHTHASTQKGIYIYIYTYQHTHKRLLKHSNMDKCTNTQMQKHRVENTSLNILQQNTDTHIHLSKNKKEHKQIDTHIHTQICTLYYRVRQKAHTHIDR